MPFVALDGTRLWYAPYHLDQESPFPPVVLVHGAGGTHLDWPAALRRLPGCRVITLDLPGHGRSDLPGRQSVDAYAADVIALLDALALPEVVIVGHSMGSAVGLTLGLAQSDRVAGLVLIGSGAKLRVHPDFLSRIRSEPEWVYARLGEWLWGAGIPDAMRRMARERMAEVSPFVTYGDYLACNTFDVLDQLGAIQPPTLVIAGTEDQMTPLKYSHTLVEAMPHAQLVVVQDAGHMLPLEQPAVVMDAIVDWLAQIFSGNGGG